MVVPDPDLGKGAGFNATSCSFGHSGQAPWVCLPAVTGQHLFNTRTAGSPRLSQKPDALTRSSAGFTQADVLLHDAPFLDSLTVFLTVPDCCLSLRSWATTTQKLSLNRSIAILR